MEFMKYSNENQVNIIPKDNFDQLIQTVFGVIADNMGKSLGPLGSNTIILDGMLTSTTKDGFAIFKNLRFHNRYKNMIYNLIKAPCTKLNNSVGDGTTTAIVFSDQLFKQYKEHKNQLETMYRLPRTLTQIWDECIQKIITKIQSYASPINPEDYDTIYNLCYVTSNGNVEISKNIADTYMLSKSPTIKLKNSPTNKSYISPVVGFEFPANLIDQAYAKNEDLSVEEKELNVLLFDHKIETDHCDQLIIPINEIVRSKGEKLLVLAPSYDALLANTRLRKIVEYEYQKYGSLNLLLGQYPMGKLEENQLVDLSIILQTEIITQERKVELCEKFNNASDGDRYDLFHEDNRMVGYCTTAILSCTNGSIFRVDGIEIDERYQDALRSAEKKLADTIASYEQERQAYAFEISKAQARISQLKMENYVYYIGSDSILQTNILFDAVDDVVKCVRSAIKTGVVPGCQLSIIKAGDELMKEMFPIGEEHPLSNEDKLRVTILKMIMDAVASVYAKILRGADGKGIIKLIPLWAHVTEEGINDLISEMNKKTTEIISTSIKQNEVFNLETLEYDKGIITSTETDVNVLLAASELVKLLISGNQCVFLDAEVNNAHREEIETYV